MKPDQTSIEVVNTVRDHLANSGFFLTEGQADALLGAVVSELSPLREACRYAMQRMETIRETNPEISLDADIEMCRQALAGNGPKLQADLVRLGRHYTQVRMSVFARSEAVEAAYWRTCSPHEWTWTPEQQANMAMYCLWAAQRLEMIKQLSFGAEAVHEPDES